MEEVTNTLPIWLQFWGPVLVALLTSIAGWIGLKKQLQKDAATAKKIEADAAKAIQEAALSLLKPYQEQVEELIQKVNLLEEQICALTDERDALKTRVKTLEDGVDLLIVQLKEAGIPPVWTGNGKS